MERPVVEGYRMVRWRRLLHFGLMVPTLGLWWFLVRWCPTLGLRLHSKRCGLHKADTVLVEGEDGQMYIAAVETKDVDVQTLRQVFGDHEFNDLILEEGEEVEHSEWTMLSSNDESVDSFRYFDSHHRRYVWSRSQEAYLPLCGLSDRWTCSDLHLMVGGLNQLERDERLRIFGENVINVPVPSYWHLFVNEQAVALRDMVKTNVSVCVLRSDGGPETIPSKFLVPGDVVSLSPSLTSLNTELSCDAALLSGLCRMDESTLTGESVPVSKLSLPGGAVGDPGGAVKEPGVASVDGGQMTYSCDTHRRNTLLCGTTLLATHGSHSPIAVVTRTGFCTTKGELICSMIRPRQPNLRFHQDAMKFVLVLAALAALGDIYAIVVLNRFHEGPWTLVLKMLDLVTIAVPPALPAALTVGSVYAQARLHKQGIYCVSLPRINLAGRVQMCCFDKTGTLTSEGLEICGVVPVEGGELSELVPVEKRMSLDQEVPVRRPVTSMLQEAMATCHDLFLMNGTLAGDPLDLEMLRATRWMMDEGAENIISIMKSQDGKQELHVLRQFPFSPELQRMTVIVSSPVQAGLLQVFMKGAPERVSTFCRPDTVPQCFVDVLRGYTESGYRVLGLAGKALPKDSEQQVHSIPRTELEHELHLLGLLVFQNPLKETTSVVIAQLKASGTRTIMITGDNLHTAVSVGKLCEIIPAGEPVIVVDASPSISGRPAFVNFLPMTQQHTYQNGSGPGLAADHYHLAMDGRSFSTLRDHFPLVLQKVLLRGSVFARMEPDQKGQLVQALQELEFCVAMCGDGANDCGALRMADVGVSLSDAEASVASPFTCGTGDISCMTTLIREGRVALVTSLSVFKFMATYSIIQFVSVLILYSFDSNLGDMQFLFIDLCIITVLVFLMGRSCPTRQLSSRRPTSSLLAPETLVGLGLHVLLLFVFQIMLIGLLNSRSWYKPSYRNGSHIESYENSSIFLLSCWQYLIMAVTLSWGGPHRQALYYNGLLLFALLLLLSILMWLNFGPPAVIAHLLQLKAMPDLPFYAGLLGLAVINFFLALFVEMLIRSIMFSHFFKTICYNRHPKSRNKRLLAELKLDEADGWPLLKNAVNAPAPCLPSLTSDSVFESQHQ
uniref:polyamine-transporting ATPase 13A2-like isoform X2 n=1 Tax=Myxine glutinosa TaxID=7769 RepID=UPI00358EB84B